MVDAEDTVVFTASYKLATIVKKIFGSKGTEQFSLVGPVFLLAVVCILSPALKCGGLIS
jgi:hypothetical protein